MRSLVTAGTTTSSVESTPWSSSRPSRRALYAAILALGALDELDGKALPWRERIAALAREKPGTPGRLSSYVPRLLEKTLADLEGLEVTGDGGK